MTQSPVAIAVLGAGNIGTMIAEGVRAANFRGEIIITRRSGVFSLEERQQFTCLTKNSEALRADVIIIAVRPTQADEVFQEIQGLVGPKHLLVSVVSGVSISRMEEILGVVPIVRAMPNIAARFGASMTCLALNSSAVEHGESVSRIFQAVGEVMVIPEEKFPEATVLCGSGTALAMKFVRAFMQAGIQHGFGEREALRIASQVLKGAAIMSAHSHPEVEIDRVTTPGGCTIAALAEMEHAGFGSALLRGIHEGVERAKKLYQRV